MTNLQAKPTQEHISSILSRNISERCNQLTRYLCESSHKDLSSLFSFIVEDIFGFGGNHAPGWGLMDMARTRNIHNYIAVLEFLSPKGPLISTAYKLLADGRIHYEFPVSCLPVNTQRHLEEGNIPPLYSHKIPYSGSGRLSSHILLNPFEYYFFHFAYLIVNPVYSKGAVFPTTMSDSLYPCLLDHYFQYFLPLDNTSSVPPISFSNSFGYSNSLPMKMDFPTSNPSLLHLSNKFFSPSIYSTEQRNYMEVPSIERVSNSFINSEYMQDEIWRSQSLILILAEFWLNLSSDDSQNIIFNTLVQESFVPSHCQMQLVRNFVKYLHNFTNSAIKSDEKTISNLSYEPNSPWNEFKKNVVSRCVQKKLYVFLKLSFQRWPLDSTYRLPLETWLSYIQPWRYEVSGRDLEMISDNEGKPIDSKWETFIAENLLFYTVIFQKILLCFFRLELTSPRQSYLLFRVAKVFSLPNLQPMISEVENKLQETDLSQLNSSLLFQSSISHSNTIHNQIRQKMFELQGIGFNYEPMFGAKVKSQVLKLLTNITEAQQIVLSKATEISQIKKSWWSTFVDFFSSSDYETTEFSLADLRKAEAHLNYSATQLCTIFRLSMPVLEDSIQPNTSDSFAESDLSFSQSSPISKVPRERISYKHVKYQGNPDLIPIRTYEVAFLVRLLYHLSTLINEKYKEDIAMLYSREDFVGSLIRQFLAPPIVCKKNDHDESLCALPPRVSLRILAHRQLLAYLLVFYAIAFFCGYGIFHFFPFLISIVLIIALIKATFSSRTLL